MNGRGNEVERRQQEGRLRLRGRVGRGGMGGELVREVKKGGVRWKGRAEQLSNFFLLKRSFSLVL